MTVSFFVCFVFFSFLRFLLFLSLLVLVDCETKSLVNIQHFTFFTRASEAWACSLQAFERMPFMLSILIMGMQPLLGNSLPASCYIPGEPKLSMETVSNHVTRNFGHGLYTRMLDDVVPSAVDFSVYDQRIVGGKEAKFHEFPFMVSVTPSQRTFDSPFSLL